MLNKNDPYTRLDGAELDRFTCKATDGLWTGIERALDNGYGTVFVLDQGGSVRGQATLDVLRSAIRRAQMHAAAVMGDVCVPLSHFDQPQAVLPSIDDVGRLVGVRIGTEAIFLPVAEPSLSHAELRNVLDAFLSTWISSTGDYIRSFERRFAQKTGVAHGVATSNGTVSLQLALAALGIGENDEVIVPDFTFAACANTVIHAGARPILVDVDTNTWCISLEAIKSAVTPRTRAVMPVHVFGRVAPMTEIREFCHARGIFVIEDCAEAHGACYDGKPVGSFSDVASFSFFANKIVTTGEGGICLTNDAKLARRMQTLRDHGMNPERRYWHEEVGFNFRMTNLQASIGCAQLDRMDEFLRARRAIDAMYLQALGGIPGVEFPGVQDSRCSPVVWFSCVLVPADKRAELLSAGRDVNIDLRPFFSGLSAMPAYARYATVCPVSHSLSMRGINLPTSGKVDERVVGRIAEIFHDVLSR